jgi:hypothetical protein
VLAHIFCQWSFLDPLETKTGDAKQERVFEQVFRQILRRVSVFIALPLHSRKAVTRLLAVNAIAETASVSIAIDRTLAYRGAETTCSKGRFDTLKLTRTTRLSGR